MLTNQFRTDLAKPLLSGQQTNRIVKFSVNQMLLTASIASRATQDVGPL